MPVYNGENFLAEAVESILAQTYKQFELFIVNDHSSDRTWEIAKSYRKRFSEKVNLIYLRRRHGAYGAMNVVMKKIRGEFIAPMDSDDISHPQRLEREVSFLLNHPGTIVVGSWARIIDKKGNAVGKKVFGTSHKEIYSSFFTVHPMVHPSCMIRRSMLLKKDMLYQNAFGVNDDYYTFFTLLDFGKFSNIPEYLLDYRIHLGNSSLQNLKGKFFNTVRIRFAAIRNLGYKPSLSSFLKFFAQILLVSLASEKVLLKVYLYIKGIYKFNDLINIRPERFEVKKPVFENPAFRFKHNFTFTSVRLKLGLIFANTRIKQ